MTVFKILLHHAHIPLELTMRLQKEIQNGSLLQQPVVTHFLWLP